MSALLWRGKPWQLLEAILLRSDLRLARIGKTAREVLADYAEAVELVEPASVPRVVPGDADDDHVIAAAVAAGAALIVSGDSDLLSMSSHLGIEIVSAAVAVQNVGATGRT